MRNTFDVETIRHAVVFDDANNRVGRVADVYSDDTTGELTFVTVNTGWFGTNETFIPLSEARLHGDELHVPYTKDFIKDAPNMEHDQSITPQQESELYRYYSLSGYDAHDVASGRRDAAGGDHTDRHRADLGVSNDAEELVRREEVAHVDTERVATQRVRLVKHVVHDTETITVPVEREEYRVVREDITDGRASGASIGEDDVEITLHEERPVVSKEVRDAERIRLETDVQRRTEDVDVDLRREEVRVDTDGKSGRPNG